MTRRVDVRRNVRAGPSQVFELLLDPSQHASLDGSRTVLGQHTGPGRLELGSRFTMRMTQLGLRYVSASYIVELEPDRVVAWESFGEVRGRRVVGGQRWRYELAALPDGTTDVTHSFLWGHARAPLLTVGLWNYPRRAQVSMTATLDILARHFASRSSPGAPR